jgi:hypothetical protein
VIGLSQAEIENSEVKNNVFRVFTRCPSPNRFPRLTESTQFKFQEKKVKSFITWMGLSLVLLFGMAFAQDSAKQDMKDAGHETKDAAKDVGHATKTTAKKTGHKVKKGTKKATHKAAEKTDEGARKVEDKTAPQ